MDVRIKGRPDVSSLSDAEIEILEETSKKFQRFSDSKLREWVHKHCREWQDPGGSSNPIALADMLRELGKDKAEIKLIRAEAIEKRRMAGFLPG